MSNSIAEIEKTDLMFVIGSNTKENHPVIALRMIKAKKKGAKLIIADPRKVPLVKFADLWMQHRPGTDVMLLNSMMHVILNEGLADHDFITSMTEGFNDSFKKNLQDYTPGTAEHVTGVRKEIIVKAARMYAQADKAGIYYTMGITQHSHGTDNVLSIANLALMTGNLGKDGGGVNPLRGQNNVQGATDMGCIPDNYTGYQHVSNQEVKEKFEALWQVKLSGREGLKAPEMLAHAVKGTLKAMYIMGENPVMSDPNVAHTIKAFNSVEFLVVQDIFMTETAALADVVLPAAAFAEKSGTFTNTERRVQRVRRALNPPGQAMRDSHIIMELSKRMGFPMPYYHTEDIFNEIGKVWPTIAGITYARLDKGGIQWPCPSRDHSGTRHLFEGGFPRGKGKFTVVKYKPSGEQPDKDFPFLLTTGRTLLQYHTGTMTRRVKPINEIAPGPYVEISEEDAANLHLENGCSAHVTSRHGSIMLKVKVSDRPDKGVVFIPFHFIEAAANALTNSDNLDPVCKIPEFKVTAVRITKA